VSINLLTASMGLWHRETQIIQRRLTELNPDPEHEEWLRGELAWRVGKMADGAVRVDGMLAELTALEFALNGIGPTCG